jgi:mannose-6-phosphate isomerase
MQKSTQSIYKLEGRIKHYDWGGFDFLAAFLSQPNTGKKPMAEFWLGAHHLSPSFIVSEKGKINLEEFISNDKENILGKIVSKKFKRLPYLLKILDVKNMLSIQVHPSKHEAEIGFAEENKKGISIDSDKRNYKDDNHKPELMVALDEFWLLHGFKPVEKLLATLESIPEFNSLLEIFKSTGYDQLYKTAMEMPQSSVDQILQPLVDRIIPLYKKQQLKKTDEDFWAARAAISFEAKNKIDRGIFSIYFLNLIRLQKGEGIFQDAGILHSYLEGRNVEIMANSDNVLRGGLTNKNIDVKELMRHVKFEETIPEVLHPVRSGNENVFITAAPDFKLSYCHLNIGEEISMHSSSAEMILVVKGKISIQAPGQQMILEQGEAALVISGLDLTIKPEIESEFFRAGTPVHSGE